MKIWPIIWQSHISKYYITCPEVQPVSPLSLVSNKAVDMAGIDKLFNEEQIEEFREAFNLFDSNQDGTVFMHSVEGVMKALGIHNPTDLKVIFSLFPSF